MSPESHGRLRALFDQAMDRPEAERLAFVQSACSGDPELLLAVTRLLEAHVEAQTFLDADTRPTKRIGRYLVTGELGRGAMGIVYEAVDPLIGRKVAVKVIRLQDFADAAQAKFLRDRLFREARSAGALSHPGIVVVYDVGLEGELAFIAMERVEGVSLYQVLASGRKLPQAEIFEILRQAAIALDYAHRNGVVHRDIKPANIMLDKGATVKIADFGIAKITSTEHHTMAGMVMGTPSYMSPEQIEALPLDGRSDQFALAVIAFELLTGRRPFQSESLATLAHMIVYADRPSAKALNPALPATVDMVFNRSLARLPADRYATCTDFVRALEAASTGAVSTEPVTRSPAAAGSISAPAPVSVAPAPVAPLGGRSKQGASNRIRYAVVGGILLLLALGGVLVYKLLPRNGQPAAAPAVAQAAPEVSEFLADPESIAPASKTTLRWEVKGAAEVTIDPGVGRVAASGAVEVAPLQGTSYLLTAMGPGGKVKATVTVKVAPRGTQAAEQQQEKARPRSQIYADAVAQRNAHMSAKALDLFRQAANLGEPRAMVDLGEIYMDNNAAEAARWFRKAADAGNSSGMLHLGAMYYLGSGVPEDYGQAAYWYRKAAGAGDADAMYNLGRMYETGLGVAKDLKQARTLYLKAANLGNSEAKARLAKMSGN